ncbi:Golgin sub A member 7 [Coemansia sp. Benny D115]|nr:Golgin sub A member 7 [Coemansia sp. Benny D115]
MFATPESMPQQQVFANGAFRSQSPQSNSHTGLTPRSSVYSDRAVYAATSRNQDTSGSSGLNLYTKSDDARSSTPPLAAPAAVAHARMSDEGQSQHHNSTPRHVYRSYNSDHQLASSREQMSLQRGTAETALSEGHRSHSIVALSTSTAAAATQRTMPGSSSGPSSSQQHWNPHETSYPNRNSSLRKPNGSGIANYNYDVDPLAQKSYALPANSDLAPQNALEYSQWQRIRVERDYSTGVSRRFTVKVPEQLVGKLDEHKFKKFVRRINNLLASAEDATLRNVLEGCLAYATLYLSTLVIKPHFKKTIDRISKLVQRENEELFRPAGYLVIDPKQTAYMFIEIVPLE